MIELLKNQFISYLNSRKAEPVAFNIEDINIKTELISETHFDINDKKANIYQPLGQGSVTYQNLESKTIRFIDFEDFINQLPDYLNKEVKRCDFIAYDTQNKTFFILNELSQSKIEKDKRTKALQQLHQAAFYFSETTDINTFINTFQSKKCIFSNKHKLLSSTPNNIADAFSRIQNYLPDPILLNYHPIIKLGYELIETAIVKV
jgi:hypothetical protein